MFVEEGKLFQVGKHQSDYLEWGSTKISKPERQAENMKWTI